MALIEGAEITALCDIRQEAVDGAQQLLKKVGLPKANFQPATDQAFNMCGYAAPKMKKVRIGFVGIGDRVPEW